MVDLSDFLAAAAPKGPRCSVGVALATLDDKHAKVLGTALADQRVTHIAVATVTGGDEWPGERLAKGAVSRHRRGECLCPT